MQPTSREQLDRLEAEASTGRDALRLSIGDWRWRLVGIDAALVESLGRRWEGFVDTPRGDEIAVRVVFDAGWNWLVAAPAESYRVEPARVDGRPIAYAYGFAVWECADGYVVLLRPDFDEPVERRLENAVRWIVARAAARAGGLAFHGAAWHFDGRAFLLLGASNVGKSTALSLAPAGRSLGDDFTFAVPHGEGWITAATPFDNAEAGAAIAPLARLPVAGLWRLFQSDGHREERPSRLVATASLLGCAAAPWSMPDLAESIAAAAESIVAAGDFKHLHFARDPGFWSLLGVVESPD